MKVSTKKELKLLNSLPTLRGISSGDAGAFDLAKNNIAVTKEERLEVIMRFATLTHYAYDLFSPRHLSHFESKGRLSLYVINSFVGHEGIEFFSFIKEKKTLLHRRKLQDSRLHSVTSIAAVGPDRLFITNMAYCSNPFLKTAELLLQSNLGALYLFDGKELQPIDSRVPSSSSLTFDLKRRLLYVGSLLNEVKKSRNSESLRFEFKALSRFVKLVLGATQFF